MIYVVFLLPVLIMVVGFLLLKYPPKKPNWFIGYRTKNSMKDKESWREANKYCGKLFTIFGFIELGFSLILLVLSFLSMEYSETLLSTIIIIQMIPLFIVMVLVEKRIGK